MDDITLQQANAAVAAAVKKAAEIGTKMDIAVVDAGAQPQGLRPDGRGTGWARSTSPSARPAPPGSST